MDREVTTYYAVQFSDPVNGRDYWRLAEKGIFKTFGEAKAYYNLRKEFSGWKWRIEECVRTVVYP